MRVKTGVHCERISGGLDGGYVRLVAILRDEDYPKLDAIDRAIVEAPIAKPADLLQSMEVLIRRSNEQAEFS